MLAQNCLYAHPQTTLRHFQLSRRVVDVELTLSFLVPQRFGVLTASDVATVGRAAAEQVIAPMIALLGTSMEGDVAQRVIQLISSADVGSVVTTSLFVGSADKCITAGVEQL